MIMDKIALALATIGALNWGCVGIFRFDLVAWICGGATSVLSRVVYTLVGIAGVWCISLLFRDTEAEISDGSDLARSGLAARKKKRYNDRVRQGRALSFFFP